MIDDTTVSSVVTFLGGTCGSFDGSGNQNTRPSFPTAQNTQCLYNGVL